MIDFGSILSKGLAVLGKYVKESAKEIATRPLKEGVFGKEGAIPAPLAIQLPQALQRHIADKPYKLNISSAFELKLLAIREPTLYTEEFRAEQIKGDDPIKSINKIHANIINYLNIVNKNTNVTFEYVRDSVKQQNTRIEDIKKSTDIIQRGYNDLSERILKLNVRVSDLERQKKPLTTAPVEESLRPEKKTTRKKRK